MIIRNINIALQNKSNMTVKFTGVNEQTANTVKKHRKANPIAKVNRREYTRRRIRHFRSFRIICSRMSDKLLGNVNTVFIAATNPKRLLPKGNLFGRTLLKTLGIAGITTLESAKLYAGYRINGPVGAVLTKLGIDFAGLFWAKGKPKNPLSFMKIILPKVPLENLTKKLPL